VPAPEVSHLRIPGSCWRAQHLNVFCETGTPLEGISGQALDIEIVMDRWGAGGGSHGSVWLRATPCLPRPFGLSGCLPTCMPVDPRGLEA
jgi:hypothetical protein